MGCSNLLPPALCSGLTTWSEKVERQGPEGWLPPRKERRRSIALPWALREGNAIGLSAFVSLLPREVFARELTPGQPPKLLRFALLWPYAG